MRSNRQETRLAVNRLAYRQSGYFSAAQARAIGYSYQAQKHNVDRGNWQRIDRGLFRLPDWPVGSDDSYARWTVWSHDQAVVSHETALSIHELSLADPDRVHLTVPPGFRATSPAVVLHAASLPGADIDDRGSYRVTNPIRTLLDVASSDLSAEQLEQAVADAVGRSLTTPRRLRAVSDAAGDRAALRIERALSKATAT